MKQKQTLPLIQEAHLKDKVVLVRVDHNVAKKGAIEDPYRIDATLGTLFYIAAKGGKPILMTHVGRPRDKKTKEIAISDKSSVQPIVQYLQNKLQITFHSPSPAQTSAYGYTDMDPCITDAVKDLRSGKIDALYLPNTRWFQGEEAKGEDEDRFARQLAALADVYVNDAFGSWQANASTAAIAKYLPAYAGFVMQKEIVNLEKILTPEKPFISVVAGAKFDTKIGPLNALLEKSDHLILGGVIYNAYLCAKYGLKINGITDEDIAAAQKFVEFSEKFPGRVLELPVIVESDLMEEKQAGKFRTHQIQQLKSGTALNYVLDIAPDSFQDKQVRDLFLSAKIIFVNAVMGYTPNFTEGTTAMDLLIDENRQALKMFGGGDTLQELRNLLPGIYMKALDDPGYVMFTGGGAVLNAIEQNSPYGMEPVKALIRNRQQFQP